MLTYADRLAEIASESRLYKLGRTTHNRLIFNFFFLSSNFALWFIFSFDPFWGFRLYCTSSIE